MYYLETLLHIITLYFQKREGFTYVMATPQLLS